VITGGEGSVGRATARALVREGCRVALAGVSADGLAAARVEFGDEVAAVFART
jgi:NADP-dependent 3-hydroxy acid dehydrogenase YdfG